MDEKKTFDEAAEEIVSLAGEKHFKTIREKLLVFNSADIAEILEEVLEEVGITETVIIFRLLPKDISVEVFSYLPSDDQVRIINAITDTEISYIIDELDFDDKIDVLEELPANLVDKILEKTPFSNASISLSALNLFTISARELKGQHPSQQGFDAISMSVRPSYSLQFSVTF